MEMKHYQTFFHETYLNLTAYIFLSKYIYIFQRLSKSEFLSFMTKVNPYNGNETMKTYSNLTPFFIRAYESVSMTFKIDISQFYD